MTIKKTKKIAIIKTMEQWVEEIAKEELPAMTSTAHLLDTFSNDDVSSLPKLSKAILHDQALSSCVLRVANNASRVGHSPISTVSRASVVLGIQAVKNICLTSKLLEGLLKCENFSPLAYDRLTRLMATSFYSGLLARMMVPDYNDDTKEQVYLATMLYRIGETAFWNSGNPAAEPLLAHLHLPEHEFTEKCREIIGTDFTAISKGLASTWNLGRLLEKSLDHPESRTVEIQIISLADQLGRFIDSPPEHEEDFDVVMKKIAQIKKISVHQLKALIYKTREQAMTLLNSFGANMLTDLIKPIPTSASFHAHQHSQKALSKEQHLLNSVMKLTELTRSSTDFNDFFELCLTSLAKHLQFDRTIFFMLCNDKKDLRSRFSFNKKAENDHFKGQISLSMAKNIFNYLLQSETPLLINTPHEVRWRNFISKEIDEMIANGAICITTVKVNQSIIGVIAGLNFSKSEKITDTDFSSFSFLVEHLNMCLSMISRKH